MNPAIIKRIYDAAIIFKKSSKRFDIFLIAI
jgi:hypothetical protein